MRYSIVAAALLTARARRSKPDRTRLRKYARANVGRVSGDQSQPGSWLGLSTGLSSGQHPRATCHRASNWYRMVTLERTTCSSGSTGGAHHVDQPANQVQIVGTHAYVVDCTVGCDGWGLALIVGGLPVDRGKIIASCLYRHGGAATSPKGLDHSVHPISIWALTAWVYTMKSRRYRSVARRALPPPVTIKKGSGASWVPAGSQAASAQVMLHGIVCFI